MERITRKIELTPEGIKAILIEKYNLSEDVSIKFKIENVLKRIGWSHKDGWRSAEVPELKTIIIEEETK